MKKAPTLVALSAPSGGGKTTICQRLLNRNPDFRLSISATTRAPRDHEIDGADYIFLSPEEFQQKVQDDEFIEYEEIHGHLYGTLKSMIQNLLEQGFTILFDVGVYGALNIKKLNPGALLIFLRPPSLEELKNRLKNRRTESEEMIQKRLERLPREYRMSEYFDYEVINKDLQETVAQIEQLIRQHQYHVTDVSH